MSTRTTRFSAEIDSASSGTSVIMSGDVNAYAIEQLLETARRNARRVRVRLEGTRTDPALSMLKQRLERLVRRGIEVRLESDEAER
jgi:hypothetical protein